MIPSNVAKYALPGLLLVIPASLSAQPATECALSFSERAITVTLLPAELGAGESVAGTETARIETPRGGGSSSACVASLRVSRITSATDFPNYSLTADNKPVVPSVNESSGGPGSDVNFSIPANQSARSVDLRAVASAEWGLQAGRRTERLQLSIVARNGAILDRIPFNIEIDIPKAVDVMFVGASGASRASQVDLGNLSATERTVSQPFGVRIWSSSSYRFQFRSQNAGLLQHRGGLDAIPYELFVDGQRYQLGSASGASLSQGSATAAGGDLFGLTVEVPARRSVAGDYQDQLTVNVTAF